MKRPNSISRGFSSSSCKPNLVSRNTRAEACKRLAANHGMIASFSRALAEDLKHSMSDVEFDAALAKAIDEIYAASTFKL